MAKKKPTDELVAAHDTGARNDVVIGIDPGVLGGLAVMNLAGEVVQTARMPLVKGAKNVQDTKVLISFFAAWKAAAKVRLVAVELIKPMPGAGQLIAGMVLQYGCGELSGVVQALGIPFDRVDPKLWQQRLGSIPRVHLPKGASDKDKQAAKKKFKQEIMNAAARRWPGADLVGSTHASATASSGIADALWIAEYARCVVNGRD